MDNHLTRYHFITENISDVIWALDVERRKPTYISKSVQKKLGFDSSELLDKPLDVWMPEKSVQIIESLILDRNKPEKSQNEGSVIESFELFHKDGSRIWTELAYSFSQNPETGKEEFIGTARDITRRVKAEQEAGRMKEMMAIATNIANFGVWEHLLDEDRIIATEQWFNIWGLTEETFNGSFEQIYSLMHPDDRDRIRKLTERAYANKEVYPATYRICRADNGETRHIRSGARFILNDQGDLVRCLGYVQDITSRVEATEKLRLSEERFRGVFDHSTNGIALVGLEGDWIKVNKGLCDIVGYTEEELTALTFIDITHPDDLEEDLSLLYELTEKKRDSYQMEKRYIHKNGDVVWVVLGVSMVTDNDGQPLHYVSQITDVTEFKKAEHQNVILLQEIHHRVKNNLAIITGLLELEVLTSEDELVTAPLVKSISRITSIAHVHELLYSSKNLATVDLSDYLSKLIASIRETLKSSVDVSITSEFKNISMNVNEAVPLGILFNELLTNSFKHAFAGRKSGEIHISASESKGNYYIVYSDNGKGVDDDIMKRDDSLGLTIIRTILEQLQAVHTLDTKGQFKLNFNFRPRFRGAHSNITDDGLFGF